MDIQEMRNSDMKALDEELMALRKEQFNLRMQQGSGQNPRSDQIKKVRKNIARIKTIMNEKTRAAQQTGEK